jgi:hypothetical protein
LDVGRLIQQLLDGPVTEPVREMLLDLLWTSRRDDLAGPFADSRLPDWLRQAVPEGDPLRSPLEEFFTKRLDDDGHVKRGVEPPRFTLGLISDDLAGISRSDALGQEQLTRIAKAIIGHSRAELATALASLPLPERMDAESSLADVSVAMHALVVAGGPLSLEAAQAAIEEWLARPDGAGPDAASSRALLAVAKVSLNEVLSRLYSDAARLSARADVLRTLAAIPAEDPAPRAGPGPATVAGTPGSADQREGRSPGWKAELLDAFRSDIRGFTQVYVTGRGQAEYDSGRHVFPLDDLRRLKDVATRGLDHLFRHLADGPPPGDIEVHDAFAYRGQQIRNFNDERQLLVARDHLRQFPFWGGKVNATLARHHADLRSGLAGEPSQESRVVAEVIEELLANPDTVNAVLEIWRGWPAVAEHDTRKILISPFGAGEGRDRQELVKKLLLTGHELLNLREHLDHRRLRASFGKGSAIENILGEGDVSALTEMWWSTVEPELLDPDDDALRREIEGGYSMPDPLPARDLPHPADPDIRYASQAAAMDLIARAGLRKVLAGFFLGDVGPLVPYLGGVPQAASRRFRPGVGGAAGGAG